MAEEQRLTKQEKKELRKMEWQEKAKKEERSKQIKKYSIWAGAVAFIGLTILGLIFLVSSPSKTSEAVNVAAVSSKDITSGNPKAKVTLIEYADFQCPACASYHPVVKQLLAEYKDKIYFVYRMFPLSNIHPNAHISAQAAFASHKQGKFFEMSDHLFTNQDNWANLSDPTGTFMDYAKELKLDTKKFQEDMGSDEAKKYVNDSENQSIKEGMNSTPTFVVNGVRITNPATFEEFKKIIDDELNKK